MAAEQEQSFTTARIKHLELIQGVVSRLAGNSATMKRFCIAVVAGGLALYKTLDQPKLAPALVALTFIFWVLDARYLQQERWFRELYDEVRLEPETAPPDFRLTPNERIRARASLFGRFASWSTILIYMPIVLLLLVFWLAA